MNFGRALRIGRSLRGFSQKEVAERARLNPSFVSLLEKNLRVPSLETQQKLAEALEIPFYLMSLLAASEKELQGATREQAELIGKELLRLISAGNPTLDLFDERG